MMASLLRRSPFLLLAAALLALAVFVVGDAVPPAQAQTPTVLVSNLGQTQGADDEWPTTSQRAQGFTTGSHAAGYTLTSIEWKVNLDSALTAAQIARLKVELWSATTAGLPDSKIVSLTAPSTVASGDVAFTAPENTTLAAGTTYFAYFFKTDADIGGLELVTTTSNAEDSGGAAGWSILDVAHFHSDMWNPLSGGQSHNIRVNGPAVQTLSTNANLSNLTASGGTSAGGTFTSFALTPAFDADTTSYSATVANSITHVKLTPTVADSGASVTVGAIPVTSGTASAAQAVEVGSNNIFAVVNAEDTDTIKNYLVVITRQGQAATPTVSLSASPNPVDEGRSVTITATLSAAQTSAVTIPLTVTDNTAESGDHGTLSSITISANSATGTGIITTTQDTDDENDETFTVALGTLPSGITAGSPSSVQITIRDDDTTTTTTTTPTPSTTSVNVCWDDDANGDFPVSDCGPANRANYGYRILIGSAADGDAGSPAIYVKVRPTLREGATVRVGTVNLDSNGNITGFVSGNSHSVTSGSQSGPIKLNDGKDYDGDGSISEDERKAHRVNTIIGLQFNDSDGVQRTYTLSVQRNVGGL